MTGAGEEVLGLAEQMEASSTSWKRASSVATRASAGSCA